MRTVIVAIGALAAAVVVALRLAGGDSSGPQRDSRASAPAPVAIKSITTARAVVRVQGPRADYVLRGRIDLRRGYRFLAHASGGVATTRPSTIWLGGARGLYDHLIKGKLGSGRPYWLDDHPPTLPMARRFNEVGAEDYVQLAMLALTKADPRQNRFDFSRLDHRPPRRDEDAWVVRPLLRTIGEIPLDWALDANGHPRSLRFETPDSVSVAVKLSAIDAAPRVRIVHADAIE